MAQGSASRIDQFFASKKKTTASSPSLKLGRVEKDSKVTVKDSKVTVAGSPSAKGSLDSYLVTSQDEKSPAKSLLTACNSTTRQGPPKRNLTLEIDLSSKYETTENLSMAQGRPQVPHRDKSEVLADNDKAAVGLGSNSLDDAVHVVENHKLDEFAAGFFPSYCRELLTTVSLPLDSNVNAHKRQGSPSTLVLEDKSSKKRHFTEGEMTCSTEEPIKQLHADDVIRPREANSDLSTEVIVPKDLVQPQVSLRKCNLSTMNVTGCGTPGPFAANFGARQTPKSTRGSSKFSPGEEFWNEAIQIADSLFDRNDNPSDQVAEEMKVDDSQYKNKSLNNISDDGPAIKEGEMLYEVASRDCNIGMDAALPSFGKKAKDLDKEVSPLPVKHFDFSLEDKCTGEVSPYQLFANNMGSLAPRDGEQIERTSVNKKTLKTAHASTLCNQAHGDGGLLGETTSSCALRKVDILRQGYDSIKANTPERNSVNFSTNFPYSEESTPSSFMLSKDHLDLSCWLPSELCSLYKKKGISKLYQWQVDCLQVDGVLQKRNLVYCASTSAGKSFVAEILMLRRVLSTGKVAILVLPYVSICAEKAEHLEALLEPLDKHVRSYYGSQGGGTLPKDTSVAVCTIEKANSLINRLLEEGRLSEIGIIVIDELHMVGDRNRGYLLELLLTKLRYGAGEGNTESSSGETSGSSSSKTDCTHGMQIVGMSATLPNVSTVADWLQAALYQTDFRPVPLEEYIKVGNTIYNKRMEIVRTISKAADFGGKDPDHIIELCNEVVQDGHSVLIFCSSRKGCESTARHIAKYLKKFAVSAPDEQSEFADITSAIDALKRSPAGLDPVLDETLPSGVAYHHAGLTVEEREIVESCYRKGLVRVLTATSTLAAGVNLPARRVIFRQPRIGRDFLDGTRYRQMAGRAGRTGIDTKGESVLLCKPEEVKRIMALINDSCPPLHSCLSDDMNGMTHAILEVVAGGIVQTANDIHRYVRCTLLNSTKPFEDVVKSAKESLRWLCQRRFLEWSDEAKLYSTTPLGRASFGSSLCPEESLIVLDDLSRAREGFVLASDLHLVYLVTPINVDVEPDWELYYERFMQLSALDQSVGNRVGVHEPFLMRMAHGAPLRVSNKSSDNANALQNICDRRIGVSNLGTLSEEQMLRVCKRFYVALILSRLVQEVPVGEVCEAFKVARGMVQALQENAGRFASMVSVFCERLGWHDLEGLVAKFQNRVSFGVRAEIVELTTIPHIKGSRARALYKAGLRTIQAIAEASIPEIVKALFESSSWAAQEGSAQRRMQLGVAKKIKNGARKVVLDRAEEARAAAFSAFKALGVEMPQFSRPRIVAGNTTTKEGTTSSTEDTTNNFVGMEQTKHQLAKPDVEGGEYLGELTSGMESVKHKASDVGVGSLAEETRAASFLSSKGLGVEIPKISRPLVPTVAGDATMKEATTSSAEDTTNNFVSMERTGHLSANPGVEGSEYLGELTYGMESDAQKKSVVGVGSLAEANSDDTMRKSVAENPEVGIVRYGTVDYGDKTSSDHVNISEMALPIQLARSNSAKMVGNKHLDHPVQEEQMRENSRVVTKESCSEKGPVNAVNIPGGIDSFLDLWNTTDEFYFDLHFNKRSEFNSIAPFEIQGIAICWKDSPVYYFTLPKDLFWSDSRKNGLSFENVSFDNGDVASPEYRFEIAKERWNRVGLIMGKKDVRKFCWNLKIQCQVLKYPAVSVQRFNGLNIPVKSMALELIDNLYYMLPPLYLKDAVDMCIVAWILWPDEERSSSPNLEKEVKKRLSSEAAVAANRNGRWRNQMRRAAHNGSCRRVAQTRALSFVLWKLLTSEGLLEALVNIEMPLVNVLADMELSGIGVDMEGCLQSRHLLREKLKNLEKEAYKLAGMTFSLSMAADIANVLYVHLKLPIPEAYNKGKQHPSTDKHCLDFLRDEHPIIPVIKEHRTLSKLLKCTLGAVCSLARLSMRTQKYTLHGHWLQTSTATGRLSMEEPNLQCVEHMVEFKMNHNEQNELDSGADHHKINPRDFFLPTQDNWLLLTADYSQIELRLMAHFSKDPSLIDLLTKPHGDVFNMIAAKWTSKTESMVSPQERDQTKRLVYGILYGMGANTLAEQLDCSSDDATEKIQSFKRSFPGVASWLQEAVTSCRQKGYVETLMQRKRFLAKIKYGNSEEKSKAQRQAVNSICQGSAADIIKIAMINIHSLLAEGVEMPQSNGSFERFHILKGRCRILLQVHDELVLEADPLVVNEAGMLLKWSMETAALLLVPLHVKLKFGRSWGSLEPLLVD